MNRMKTDELSIGRGVAERRAAVEAGTHCVALILVNNASVTASGPAFSQISRGWKFQAPVDDEPSAQHAEFFLK